ncbi:MAG: DNA polymerase III subunit gamma/tau [Flavobacteriales bacterium]|nr:DNA polymerase III subunit gamma/tau [Flavobacteriales bacterium]
MDQYVVSARKYRPATFDSVVGQDHVTGTLKNAIRTNHVAQAFLFTGPRGVGKTTCARILARTVNCEDLGEDLVACGKCPPCKTFDEGHSMNIFELDAASNNSVDDIRTLITQVTIAPQVGVKKVYIIDEVHMLSPAAFNAFLKTLEEPPSYAIFILATTEKHKIIPTILSRCQVFDFRRIRLGDITGHLADIARKEHIEVEQQALHVIAQKADGGLRDALSIFDQLVSFSGNKLTYQDVVTNLNVLDHEHYFRVTDSIIRGDIPAALVEYNAILQQGFDGHLFVSGLARHFRDLLVSQDARTLPLLEVGQELTARYGDQAQRASRDLLVNGLDRLAHCDSQYKASKEPRLLVELTLIQMCRTMGTGDSKPENGASASAATDQKKSPDPSIAAEKAPEPAPAASLSVVSEPVEATVPIPHDVPSPKSNGVDERLNYVPKRRLAGQVSIKETAAAAAVETAPMVLQDEDGSGPASSREVNPALLLKIWRDYAMLQKKNGRDSLHATLLANEPKVSGPGRIAFTIVNKVQENYMREEKPELLGYIRRNLGDPGLELEVIQAEIKVKPRYTTLDKFKLMAEKNPALLVLREELDLDLG